MAVRWEPIGDGRVLAVNDDHRFGSDAVLLSFFAAPQNAQEVVCDLGTGCGCIPFLLLNQAIVPRRILGVDKQAAAVALCRLSVERNALGEVLHFTEADWHLPHRIAEAGSMDRVISNPPYFPSGSGRQSGNPAHAVARHEQPDTLSSLCAAAKYLLRFGGHFCMCHRPERLPDIFSALRQSGLEPKTLQLVQRSRNTAPWLVLLDAVKGGKPSLQMPAPYILEDNGVPTELYQAIYGKYKNI